MDIGGLHPLHIENAELQQQLAACHAYVAYKESVIDYQSQKLYVADDEIAALRKALADERKRVLLEAANVISEDMDLDSDIRDCAAELRRMSKEER